LNSHACAFPGCTNRFKKVNGILAHGRWFCCENCADKDPKTQKMKEIEAKIKES
jgi:hypothetical protein